jgi:hypothetical protein
MIGDNLNKYFRNKKREYQEDKINELDLLADSYNILNTWKKYFSQL